MGLCGRPCTNYSNMTQARMICMLTSVCFPLIKRDQARLLFISTPERAPSLLGLPMKVRPCALCRAGAVTKEMLRAVPLKLFAFSGAIQALSQVLGFMGAARLPGMLISCLCTTTLHAVSRLHIAMI